MAVERLTPQDEVMVWADRAWPQDIGALATIEAGFDLGAVKAVVGSRLDRAPRFRQLLRVPRPGLGAPYWADDTAFDIDHHIRSEAVDAPGDEAALLAMTESLRRRRLDPSRPLWEMWFLTGLADGRAGLFVRTHHCVADGIAGVATLASFLDTAPDASLPSCEPWHPAAEPTEDELAADAKTRAAEHGRSRIQALEHPLRTSRGLASVAPALRELFAEPHLDSTTLDRRVGPARSLALVRASLDTLKEVAHAHGAKVNDVLLAAIAGGLRELFAARREAVTDEMRVYVPMSLRHGLYEGARGNDIAQMVVPLPVSVEDPVEALASIAVETARRKARARPSVGGLPTKGVLGKLMLGLIDRQHVNVESADLPGSPVPLYLAGTRILELFPILPLIGHVSLGVGAISYAGQFNVGAIADPETVPDLEVFASGVRATLARLEPARAV